MTFNDLFVSQTFTFESEAGVGGLQWQGARGPWVKTGRLSYRALVDGYAHGPTYHPSVLRVRVTPVT